jgi:hypothetical protein
MPGLKALKIKFSELSIFKLGSRISFKVVLSRVKDKHFYMEVQMTDSRGSPVSNANERANGVDCDESHLPSTQTVLRVEDYLVEKGGSVKIYDLTKEEERKGAELQHRIDSRDKVLRSLIIPMYVIPCWLLLMLSVSVIKHPLLNNSAFSEKVQLALLGTLATDVLGLCFLVTRDLFPQSRDTRKGKE